MIKIVETIRQWNSRKVAVAALSHMDERMLNDIGVRRADIPSYVRGQK